MCLYVSTGGLACKYSVYPPNLTNVDEYLGVNIWQLVKMRVWIKKVKEVQCMSLKVKSNAHLSQWLSSVHFQEKLRWCSIETPETVATFCKKNIRLKLLFHHKYDGSMLKCWLLPVLFVVPLSLNFQGHRRYRSVTIIILLFYFLFYFLLF